MKPEKKMILTLRITNEDAQILLFKRWTNMKRYNILMNAQIISMEEEK